MLNEYAWRLYPLDTHIHTHGGVRCWHQRQTNHVWRRTPRNPYLKSALSGKDFPSHIRRRKTLTLRQTGGVMRLGRKAERDASPRDPAVHQRPECTDCGPYNRREPG